MQVTLPTQRKAIVNDISQHTLLFSGQKKIGKSSLAIQFPDHFMLEMEPGNATHLDANYEDIHSYEQAVAFITELEKQPNYCKTLVIDEIQILYDLTVEQVRKEQKLDMDEKFQFDQWRVTASYFRDLIFRIQKLPMGRIYTAHLEEKEAETRSGKKFNRLEPRLSGQCNRVMENLIKMCGTIIIGPQGNRLMQIERDEYVEAYNCFQNNFINPLTNKKLTHIPLGDSPQQAYNNFIQAFNNQLPVSIELPTPQSQPQQNRSNPPAQQQPPKRFAINRTT